MTVEAGPGAHLRRTRFAILRLAPRLGLAGLGALAALTLCLWWAGAEPASAQLTFCSAGTAAGECDNPQGVAADTETGRVYVADRDNDRVDVFESDGTFVMAFGWGVIDGEEEAQKCTTATGCVDGIPGGGAGQLDRPARLAVDNEAASPSRHHLYVTDADSPRVQEFDAEGNHLATYPGEGECALTSTNDPIAVGPEGELYLSEGQRVVRMSESGACVDSTDLVEAPLTLTAVAVDSEEDVYVRASGAGGEIRKFDLAGPTRLCEGQLDPGSNSTALAVNGEDHLFAAQPEVRVNEVEFIYPVTEYDAGCETLRRFGYGSSGRVSRGIFELSSPEGDVIIGVEKEEAKYLDFPTPGPVAVPVSPETEDLGNARATLIAEVNPEGEATSFRFDYVDQESFEEEGFESPNAKSTPTEAIGAEGFDLRTVKAQIGCEDPVSEAGEGKCLTPETEYRFRVVATNASNPEGLGDARAEGAFETLPPLEFEFFASEVGTDSARLSAEVNPLGIPAAGHFEYVSERGFEEGEFEAATRVPAEGELDFGAGEEALRRGVTIYPLAPGGSYRYRFVVSNPLIEPIQSKAKSLLTFSTPPIEPCPANEAFRTGASAALPDCRAYELVSPLDKSNGDIVAPEIPSGLPAVLEQASLSGSKLAYGTFRAFGDAPSAPFTSQYVAARGAGEWRTHAITPPRSRSVLESLSMLDTELKALSPDLCESWLRTVAEPTLAPGAVAGYPNLYRRSDAECGPLSHAALTTAPPPNVGAQGMAEGLELQGVSADGEVAIFTAPDSLTEGSPPQPGACGSSDNKEGCQLRLYRQDAEGLSYVCESTGGTPLAGACTAGTRTVSAGDNRDASLANAISADGRRVFWTAKEIGPGEIFVSEPGEQTKAVSKAGEELSGTSASQYWWAAEDGSAAIFTSGSDLYRYEVEGEETIPLAGGVSGVMGASEDAALVYFASEDVLSGESAEGRSPEAGEPNLYLAREGAVEFIMTLTGLEGEGGVQQVPTPVSVAPFKRVSRVSPDGMAAAWMSAASPTGYDNRDAASGEADQEVFVYDAAAEELRCASCNPSGGRPAGEDVGKGTDFWVAGQIPAWESALYAPRALSEDGSRLYFESTDALVARDSNGVGDLYQWEREGAGGCEAAEATYSPAAGGCVDLISSGQGSSAARLIDASPSGGDVFFTTLASLVSHDYGLVDVYDARVNGGLPAPPAPPAECEGESCQSPAPAPIPSTPSSLTYRGPGNLSAPPATRCARPARRARALSRRAKALRRAARRSKAPAAARRRARAASRAARSARRLSRNAKRCRARVRSR